jgi:hypothetical protein
VQRYRKSGARHSAFAGNGCFQLVKRGVELVQIWKLSFIASSFCKVGF